MVGDGRLGSLGRTFVGLAEKYPDFQSSDDEFCTEIREIGTVAHQISGLSAMMLLHDAVIAALGWTPDGCKIVGDASGKDPMIVPFGSNAPGRVDYLWDGIGEWQKERGWRFILGGDSGAGHYEFGTPVSWPYGYMPMFCDCREPDVQGLLLRLMTTQTDDVAQRAVSGLQWSTNPFVLAASGWAVGRRQMREALPHLLPLLKHSSHIVRVYATEAALKLGGNPQELLPVLMEVIASKTTLPENYNVKWRSSLAD